MLKKATARFEKRLAELHEGLSRPRTHKKIEAIWKRIGRLKANKRCGPHYHIEVIADPTTRQRPVAGSRPIRGCIVCAQPDRLVAARTYIADRSGGGVSFSEIGVGTTS